ncbi:hypothetical protein AB0J80_22000 [Actinoplanes sp. NPDC049548]|uniref:hypothetical protein n=1 Tax=Actinoplanes sp. NPDC049548 TaxID=3155152 RepID=UPI00343C9705
MVSRMRVGSRLAVSFGLLIVLLGVTAGAGWAGMRTQDRVGEDLAKLAAAREAVQQFLYQVAEVTGWQGLVIAEAGTVGGAAATEPTAYNRAGELASKAALYQALDALETVPLTAGERATAAPLR